MGAGEQSYQGAYWMIVPAKIRIRGLVKEGMTVRQLIAQLRLLKMDSKVVYYDRDGNTYNVINAVQDSKGKVAIF